MRREQKTRNGWVQSQQRHSHEDPSLFQKFAASITATTTITASSCCHKRPEVRCWGDFYIYFLKSLPALALLHFYGGSLLLKVMCTFLSARLTCAEVDSDHTWHSTFLIGQRKLYLLLANSNRSQKFQSGKYLLLVILPSIRSR